MNFQEIKVIFLNLKNTKPVVLNQIPLCVLKCVAAEIATPKAPCKFNVKYGCFPKLLKIMIINPIYKKTKRIILRITDS